MFTRKLVPRIKKIGIKEFAIVEANDQYYKDNKHKHRVKKIKPKP